jgi:hypothetical protein
MAATTDPRSNGTSPTPVTLREQTIDGERILNVGPAILVASQSQDHAWYVVEDGRCSSPGVTYRRSCRHLGPAQLAAELDRREAVLVASVSDAEPGRRIFGDRKPSEIITLRDDLA